MSAGAEFCLQSREERLFWGISTSVLIRNSPSGSVVTIFSKRNVQGERIPPWTVAQLLSQDAQWQAGTRTVSKISSCQRTTSRPISEGLNRSLEDCFKRQGDTQKLFHNTNIFSLLLVSSAWVGVLLCGTNTVFLRTAQWLARLNKPSVMTFLPAVCMYWPLRDPPPSWPRAQGNWSHAALGKFLRLECLPGWTQS